jgi:hypothetical protein
MCVPTLALCSYFEISASAACSGTIVSGFFGKHTRSVITMLLLSVIGSWMIRQQYAKTTNLKQCF